MICDGVMGDGVMGDGASVWRFVTNRVPVYKYTSNNIKELKY